jgi:TolB-like protein
MRIPSLLLICLTLCAGGCASLQTGADSRPYQADARLIATSHQAVDKLLASMQPGKVLDHRQPLLVASLVNVDTLNSSRLGRTMAEQIGSRLATHGYAVVEMKLRDTVFVKQGEGEMLLSREVKEISRNQQAQGVLVGTYAQSLNNVYVTLKLISVADGQILAAHDFVLPIDSEVRSLLWSKQH